MNQVYRVIWNATAGTWTAAAETAKGHTKSTSSIAVRSLALALIASAAVGVSVPRRAEAYVAGDGAVQGNPGNTVVGDYAVGSQADCVDEDDNGGAKACAVIIGNGASSTGSATVVVGDYATTTGNQSVAIGSWANAAGSDSSAIGAGAKANGSGATAIGSNSSASNDQTVAIGAFASAFGSGSSAIGYSAIADGQDSLAIGSSAGVVGQGAIALGSSALSSGDNTVSVGTAALTNGDSSVAVGANAYALRDYGVALGADASSSGISATAIGSSATAGGQASIALGSGAYTNSDYSVALGSNTRVLGASATAIGSSAKANGQASVALGSQAFASADNSVALGAGSTTNAILSASAYNPGASTLAGIVPVGEVSVGSVGNERRMTNVAAGSAATDAVNVSQLTSEAAKSNTLGNSVATALGGTAAYDSSTGAITLPSYTVQGTTYNDVGAALDGLNTGLNTTNTNVTNVAGDLTTLTNNINNGTVGLVQQAAAGADLTVGKDTDGVNVSFADKDGNTRTLTNVTAGNLSATSTDAVNGSQLFATNTQVGQNTVNIAKNTGDISNLDGRVIINEGDISNLTNNLNNGTIGLVQQAAAGADLTVGKDTDGVNVSFADKDGNTRTLTNVTAGTAGTDAVNLDQLNAVKNQVGNLSDLAVTYDDPSKASITLSGAAGTQIKNVMAGTDATDAVNVGQLDAAKTDLGAQITTVSNNLSTQIGDVTTNLTAATRFFKADGLTADADAQVTVGSNSVAIGANSVASEANTVSVGAVGSERKIVNVAAGVNTTDAVNVGQLSAVSGDVGQLANQVVKYDANPDGSINYGSVTLAGDPATGTQLKNIADGVDAHDAVNVGQLDAAKTDLGAQITTVSNNLSTQIGDVTTNLTAATRFFKADGLASDADAQVTAGSNSVAIGANSVANRSNSVSVGDVGSERQIVNVAEGTVGTDAVNLDQLTAVKNQVGNLSDLAVTYDDPSKASITLSGAAGTQIKNVMAGTDATDAVNVGQLDAAKTDLGAQITTVSNNLSTQIGDVTTNLTAATRFFKADGLEADTEAQVTAGSNSVAIGANSVANRSNSVSVGDVGSERQIVNVAEGTVGTDAVNLDQLTAVKNQVGNLSDLAVTYDDPSKASITLDGAAGTQIKNVANGVDNNDAVNVSQLKASGLIDTNGNALAAVTYDQNADGSINYNSVTMGNGKSTGPVAIHNVAAGVDDTDAVNVKQLTDSLAKSGLADADGNALDAVVYDPGSNRGQVTLGGLGATTNVILTNVAAGRITATSTDAVNGSQLFGLQQQVTNIDNRLTTVEANPAVVNPPAPPAEANPPASSVEANPHVATTDDATGTIHAATVNGTSAVAVGAGATASNNNSVALGAGSVTTQDNSVSVGSAGNERAITNVQAGVNDTDAANVGQMNTAISNSASQTLQSANSYTDQRFNQVEQDINNVDRYARQGIAASAALNMVTPYLPGKTTLNAGVAGYRGEVGLGVGVSHWNRRGNLNVNAGVSSAGGNSTIIRAGVGVVFGD
ncbi:beta strand repeat-containing protein [Glaciimonas soli]|nr:ESPR-type extended signal peptide-containing protein [Glaciimonas soli]